MNFVLFIARRYLLAKKSHNVINVITWISIAGIAVGTAGFIMVLSVFNGFGNLVLSLYDSFDSDIKITPTNGKYMTIDNAKMQAIKNVSGVNAVWPIVEDNALLRNGDKQMIARVKGITKENEMHSEMRNHLLDGVFVLQEKDKNFMVLGGGVAYGLAMSLRNPNNTLGVFYPNAAADLSDLTNVEAFKQLNIVPSGVFGLQQDFDNKYVFVPIEFARELFDKKTEVSALEIMLNANTNSNEVSDELKTILPQCEIKTRIQQHGFLYNILMTEKFVAFLILGLILLIATFSILGSLTMLIIEKKKDINVLYCMGCELATIKKIFFAEGVLITLTGAVLGLVSGFTICALQQNFGFIKLGAAVSFVTDAYPVAMEGLDFIITLSIVCIIGLSASAYISLKLLRSDAIEVHYLNTAKA